MGTHHAKHKDDRGIEGWVSMDGLVRGAVRGDSDPNEHQCPKRSKIRQNKVLPLKELLQEKTNSLFIRRP